MTEQDIFLAALEIADPAQRAEYLNRACAGDAALRQQVEALLASHQRAGAFLDVPALQQVAARVAAPRCSPEEPSTEPAADQGGIDLSFLQPSAEAGSLGRLGHYEVQQVIGQGGYGIVLKAFDEILRRVVAIKVMTPELAATSPARKRFLREARAAAAIRHENVISIYAVEDQPIPFLVMEHIAGQTLQQMLDATGPLGPEEVVRIGQQIARGLEAAHALGLIHRDIKPGNILLEGEPGSVRAGSWRVKITDFGLARTADDASITQSGVIAGTPLYMSPEQALGESLDQRSDLFSLGSVLYVMCCGRPPFRAATTLAVLKRVAEDQPRPIQEIIPEVPAWLTGIIAQLHAKKPEERFASSQEVADLLARCLAELQQRGRVESLGDSVPLLSKPAAKPVAPEPAAPARPLTLRRPRGRRWAAAAVVLLALLAGLGLTEATGVTHVRGTVIRLFSPDGTLVVEVDDPGVSVSIDGEEMVITGTGAKEIRLKPGQYQVRASKDGKTVRQELVTVTKNGRQVVKVSREANLAGTDPDRTAAEWVLRDGGEVTILAGQQEQKLLVNAVKDLPAEGFKLISINRIGSRRRLTPADLDYLRPLADLRGLTLHLTDLTDADLGRLAQFAAAIRYRFLSLDSPVVTDAGLENLAALPDLDSLHLCRTRMTDAGLGSIAAMPRLGDLILNTTPGITDAGLAKLRGLKLWNLSLAGNPQLTDAGLEHLKRLGELRILHLNLTKVTEAGVKKLATARPQCRILWDGGVIEPRTDPDRTAAEWVLVKGGELHVRVNGRQQKVKAVGDLPAGAFSVESVSLWGCPGVTDDDLDRFTALPQLYTLGLGQTAISDVGLAHLLKKKGLTRLVSLDLDGTRVSDAGLPHLAGLTTLKCLGLARTEVSDPGLRHLAPLKDLGGLFLDGTRVGDTGLEHLQSLTKLNSLGLNGTQVSDAGLEQLRKLPNLANLSLFSTRVSDTGLRSLHGLTRLEKVNLTATRVTPTGIAALQKHLPQCQIITTE